MCVKNVDGFLCACIDFQSIAAKAIGLMAVMELKMATSDEDRNNDSSIKNPTQTLIIYSFLGKHFLKSIFVIHIGFICHCVAKVLISFHGKLRLFVLLAFEQFLNEYIGFAISNCKLRISFSHAATQSNVTAALLQHAALVSSRRAILIQWSVFAENLRLSNGY